MKIAFPTNNGTTINRHFGQATHFLIVELDDNRQEISRNLVPKMHHGSHNSHNGNGHHGPHQAMFAPLQGCQIVIAGGMGSPAAQAIEQMGLTLLLTRASNINQALQAWQNNTLTNEPALVHAPGHHRH
ncbi:MAG: hypothetical protein D6768_05600 [Chloroflexi bacterium]|nr:MAG: hypothetical protein D6768_05600 [Chloroflexota bacterium]